MKAIILKCPHNARFHFGIAAPDNDSALSQTSECFHSDTLFSALVILCSQTFPERIEGLITAFKTGAVQISSGSFCIDFSENGQFNKRIFFLPKPNHFDAFEIDLKERKMVKGIQYISKTIWEKGLAPTKWKEAGCYAIQRKFLVHPEDIESSIGQVLDGFYKIKTEPKIADHARKRENNIFFKTDVFLQTSDLDQSDFGKSIPQLQRVSFQPHYYFLLKFATDNTRLQALVNFLIDNLQEEGLGGAISTGCGKIESLEKIDWQFNIPEPSTTHWVSASLVALSEEQPPSSLEDVVASNIIVRGGRKIGKDDTLKRIKLLKAGALIKRQDVGEVATLRKSPPYLRYGKAFALPIPEKFMNQNDGH